MSRVDALERRVEHLGRTADAWHSLWRSCTAEVDGELADCVLTEGSASYRDALARESAARYGMDRAAERIAACVRDLAAAKRAVDDARKRTA